jgi:hypothetical protein
LDGVTGVLLGRVGGGVIDETLHTSRLFLTAPGKPAQGLLETRVTGRAIHFGDLSDVPVATIQALKEVDFANMRAVEALGRWLALAQTEADPFKKFLWAFAGLEVASKKLAGVTKGQLVSGLVFTVGENHIAGDALREIVWPSPGTANDAIERDPQRNTVFYFATMALICFPEAANRDVVAFKQLQGLRNKIHGSYLGIDEARRGADESIVLLRRYIPEVSKRLL